jgi:hypothetical protein
MNKLLPLLAGLSLAGGAARAQVTPEFILPGTGSPAMVKIGGDMRYLIEDYTANEVVLYGLNHAVYKRLPIPALAGYTNPDFRMVSDALFDTDPTTAEVLIGYTNSGDNSLRKTVVYTETGSTIIALDSVFSNSIGFYNTSAGAKMVTTPNYNPTGGAFRPYTRVYRLAGTYVAPLRTTTAATTMEGSAYPNPGRAGASINLPYQLAAGQRATLDVLDMTGRTVRSFTIAGGTFDHLLLSPGDLPAPGAYVYRVTPANGGATMEGKRFVIE